MRLRKLFCPLVALVLMISCFGANVSAEEVFPVNETQAVTRATSSFTIDVPAGTLRQANTSFPLYPGEVVTIKASYAPFSANVDFGLIAPNGRFYYVTVTDGSIDQSIEITEQGKYTFAVRNNSSYSISVTGFVNY